MLSISPLLRQGREEKNPLKVQITGRNGGTTYGEYSLKDHGSLDGDDWHLDMSKKIVDGNILKCVCPLDEESIAQLAIHVGGIALLQQFLMAENHFNCTLGWKSTGANDVLSIGVVCQSLNLLVLLLLRLRQSMQKLDLPHHHPHRLMIKNYFHH